MSPFVGRVKMKKEAGDSSPQVRTVETREQKDSVPETTTRPRWVKAISQVFRHGAGKFRARRKSMGVSMEEDHGRPPISDGRSERISRLTHLALGSEDYTSVLNLPDDEAQSAADLLQTVCFIFINELYRCKR